MPYHSSCMLSTPRAGCPINLFAVSPTLCGAPSTRVTPTGSLETSTRRETQKAEESYRSSWR